jgi:hypothetical protein
VTRYLLLWPHVLVKLTGDGEAVVERLALDHWHELQSVGPKFVKVLQSLIAESNSTCGEDTEAIDPQITGNPRKDSNHG